MNPLTNVKNQNRLNERELSLGVAGNLEKSWHKTYKDSAWIYIGGLAYDLNEGDILAVFSQYGEVVNINLVRDGKTGKSRGFCYICYADQRSTVLAVDNFNGITLLKRVIRVDHVEDYKVPKYKEDADEVTKRLWEEGCAPKPIRLPTPEPVDEAAEERRIKKAAEAIIDLDEIDPELVERIKEEKRKKKKIKRLQRKLEKYKKKEEKLLAKEGRTMVEDLDWRAAGKLLDKGVATEEELYNMNEHFNFGKKEVKKEEVKYNPRPTDFVKTDWRDIAMWQIMRDRERAEKGEKKVDWKDEEHYLPSRFKRD